MKFLLSTLFLLTSCATQLPPKEQRKLEYVEKTSVSKSKSYSSALAFIGSNFGDSKEVIKVSDPNAGTIVIHGNTKCNIFRQSGDINDYFLKFYATLNFKNNKMRFLFEDLQIVGSNGKPVSWEYNQLTSKEKVDKAGKNCLKSLKAGIINKINNKNEW